MFAGALALQKALLYFLAHPQVILTYTKFEKCCQRSPLLPFLCLWAVAYPGSLQVFHQPERGPSLEVNPCRNPARSLKTFKPGHLKTSIVIRKLLYIGGSSKLLSPVLVFSLYTGQIKSVPWLMWSLDVLRVALEMLLV